MGKQLNFYRSTELQAELEAEAAAQTKNNPGHEPFTAQDVLRLAWCLRPSGLKLARPAKATRK
jgi:hypothetical protein